jgi:hypothetical protein
MKIASPEAKSRGKLYVQVYLQPRQWCPFFGFIYLKNYLFICIFLNLYKIDLSFVKNSWQNPIEIKDNPILKVDKIW